MNKAAILHIPLSNYAHSTSENQLVFRLRAGRDDLKKCTLYYGDRACQINPITCYSLKMDRVAQDELFDYYEAILTSPYKRVAYYFEISDGVESCLYYSGNFTDELCDDRWEYYQFPFIHRKDIAEIPSWVSDAVVYNIFPDSFASGKRYIENKGTQKRFDGKSSKSKLGGTINGITENIDYIKYMGFNCIYINPIFAAGEYHKYDTIDYYNIDPCLGTNDDFKRFVDTCHENDMRVVIDGVFNHCGYKFFAFQDVLEKQEKSKYVDWFYRLDFPIHFPDNMSEPPPYECFGYERLMPKLNTSNKEVIDYFCDVCRYWIREYGIDGWRLDVANEIDDNFWREFRKVAKDENSDCFLIGEVWDNASHWLQGDQFDSSMNYNFRKNLRDFVALSNIDAYKFDAAITDMRMRYNKNIFLGQLNLIDSHDVPRFLSLCGGNVDKIMLAIVFQMTFSGVPSVFYGDEQCMLGTNEDESRKAINWVTKSDELVEFFKELIEIRKKYNALSKGEFETVLAKKDSKLYVYKKKLEDSKVIIALNMGDIKEDISDIVPSEYVCQFGYESTNICPLGYGIYTVQL